MLYPDLSQSRETKSMFAFIARNRILLGYLAALSGPISTTIVLIPFREAVNSTIIALAFLLVVLFVATLFGSRTALLSSCLSVLSFNFFFLPPFHTFTIDDPRNWMALFAFFVVAITVGQLSATAKRRAEEAETLFDELQEAFERASQAEALKRSEKLKSALLDAVTHDLRTPLTSIKAAITTLIEEQEFEQIKLDPEGRREFFDVINEETDRLNNFIQGMVELAKIEAGALHVRKNWGSVQDMIDSAVKRAEKLIGSRHIIIDIERDLPSFFVDSRSLSEVVYTLLDNAVKYSPVDSAIRIYARLADTGMIEIAVEDQGRGIPPEMRERVFSKFFRSEGEEVHSTSSGLGLGLAIARGIIDSQGGKIWIADGTDGFTMRVAFLIPVGDDEQ